MNRCIKQCEIAAELQTFAIIFTTFRPGKLSTMYSYMKLKTHVEKYVSALHDSVCMW